MSTAQPKKIMWLSPMCCLDRRSGAACQMRSVLTTLASAGWEAHAVHMTLCDGQEQYPIYTIIGKKYAVPENYGQTLNFERDGVQHHLFYTQSSYGRDLTQEEAQTFYSRAKKSLEKIQPDVVLTYGSSQLCLALIRAARQNCRTLIFYLANPSYDDPELFRPFDQVLVPSNFQSQYYQERLGIKSDVLRTLLPETSQISPKEVLSTQAPEMRKRGFITMINPSLAKGATLYARLVQMALRERPDLLFLAVEGRMTNEQWAQAGVDLANMSNIWWIPNQQDVRTIYARTSILLFPSFWNEASGRSIAEAQLGGIPVLASNHAGIPEQLNGGGFRFDIPERCRERYTKVPSSEEIRPWLDTIYRLMDDEDFYRQALHRALECGAMFERKVVEQDVIQRFEAFARGENLRPPLDPEQKTALQIPVVKGEKIGRNDPCPCGSGKKVKKCCGVEAASRALQQQAEACGFQAGIREDEAEASQNSQEADLEISISQQQEQDSTPEEIQAMSWRDSDSPRQQWLLELDAELRISVPDDLSVLSSYMLLEQERWLEPETELVRRILRPGMRALDIGACFGVYALPMAWAVGRQGELLAFEPGRLVREYLEISKQENALQQLQILPQALATSQGRGRLLDAETPEQSRLEDTSSGYPGQDVELQTLDSWWQEEDRPDIDFVKLDVGGRESAVLQGGLECLAQCRPMLLVSIRDQGALNRLALQTLADLGYEFYQYLPGPGLLVRYDQQATPEAYLMNLAAIRPEQVQALQEQGLIAPEELEVPEPGPGHWQEYLGSLPWSAELVPKWQKGADSAWQQEYLQILDFLCAAQHPETAPAHRLAQTQWAAQHLVRIYRDQHVTSVALSLARAMQELGFRQQAVQVLDRLLLDIPSGLELDSGLPFLPPLPELDRLELHSSLQDWILARCTESLVMLRSFSGYFRPQRDLELLRSLESNPERSLQAERWKLLCALRSGRSKDVLSDSGLWALQDKNIKVWTELIQGPKENDAQAREQQSPRQPEQSCVQDSQDFGLKPARIRRNDPCPCGSGKKAKNCCGTGNAEANRSQD